MSNLLPPAVGGPNSNNISKSLLELLLYSAAGAIDDRADKNNVRMVCSWNAVTPLTRWSFCCDVGLDHFRRIDHAVELVFRYEA
jgi:hypothetical protein